MTKVIELALSGDEFENAFRIWFRNACTSNTPEQAIDIFNRLSLEEQEELRGEYRQLRKNIADGSEEPNKFIQD